MDGRPHRPTLRDRKRELTRRALLDGAREAFSRNRYSDVTIEDITSSSGASRATFYQHFTKAELLGELLVESVTATHPTQDRRTAFNPGAADLSGIEGIRAWMTPYLRMWIDHGQLGRAWVEGDATDADIRRSADAYFAAAIEEMTDNIQRVRGDGISREEARARAAVMYFELMGFCYFVLGRGLDVDPEAGLTTLVEQWQRLVHGPLTSS